MIRLVPAAALLTAALSPAVAADTVVLSDKYGRAMVVGAQVEPAVGLTPATLTAAAIATEFKQLCLADPATAGSRAGASALALAADDAVFAAEGKRAAARVPQWRGASARLSVWTGGDDAALQGRPLAIRDRGVSITSGYGPFKAEGAQCNLDLLLGGFSDAQGLADALTAAVGQAPVKLVVKPGFADGYWETPTQDGTRRVAFAMVDLKKSTQPLHLTVQNLAPKAPK